MVREVKPVHHSKKATSSIHPVLSHEARPHTDLNAVVTASTRRGTRARFAELRSAASSNIQSHKPEEVDVDAIHASLAALGAPLVSRADLARLAQGPFGTVLSFCAIHIVGRGEAHTARRAIAASRLRVDSATGTR